MAMIEMSMLELWQAYGAKSGRVECPIKTLRYGQATHLYCGYGRLRLEKIDKLIPGKKGFQGKEVYNVPIMGMQAHFKLEIED